MSDRDEKHVWHKYCERELAGVLPVLLRLGFKLEDAQPHLWGERYLMQAMTTKSGKKLVLLGHFAHNGRRVVIKATSDRAGAEELEHERECRRVLGQIHFAYQVFFSPEEIFFTKKDGYTISVQAFIEQKRTFFERPLAEQFSLALKSFKAQEGAHATTYEHKKFTRKSFSSIDADGYIKTFAIFKKNILTYNQNNKELTDTLRNAQKFFETNRETIEQYCGFLTHVDFVPHNIRIVNSDIYLLDHSSLRFGNKYEGWARFLNFMTLYNQPLEEALVRYVRDNRTSEESLALKLMRIYRLGEIIWYYTNTLEKSLGDLHALNQKRVEFWSLVLDALLKDEKIPLSVITQYQKDRDSLRSEEEKLRQRGLH